MESIEKVRLSTAEGWNKVFILYPTLFICCKHFDQFDKPSLGQIMHPKRGQTEHSTTRQRSWSFLKVAPIALIINPNITMLCMEKHARDWILWIMPTVGEEESLLIWGMLARTQSGHFLILQEVLPQADPETKVWQEEWCIASNFPISGIQAASPWT